MRSLSLLALLSFATFAITSAGCSSDSGDLDDEADQEPASSADALTVGSWKDPATYSSSERASILRSYANLDPGHAVPRDLLANAVLFYHANKAKVRNGNYVTVIDFAKHSGKKRFFIVDLRSGAVRSHVVAHGSGSDPSFTGYAKTFSNTNGSNMSSLGYYVTGETYSGNHGRSLRLDGVSSTNSNVRARAIVIHGASYVSEGNAKQGRSWGCPALPEDVKDQVITMLANGSVMYAGLSDGSGSDFGSGGGSAPADPDPPSSSTGSGTGTGTGSGSGTSSGGSSSGSGGGQSCTSSGQCNPGSVGSGLMCENGHCVPGCTASWMCPGTCDVAARRCK